MAVLIQWHSPIATMQKAKGLSLIEVAIIMVLVFLALGPIVKMVSGPMSEEGNLTRLTGIKSKETVLASSLIEQALSGDIRSLNCYGHGSLGSVCASNAQQGANSHLYPQNLYYQWQTEEIQTSRVGYSFYKAILNVCETSTCTGSKDPILSMPSYVPKYSYTPDDNSSKVGMVLALDTSGSMLRANTDLPQPVAQNYTGTPFFLHRYDINRMKNSADMGNDYADYWLDKWDDKHLDIVYGKKKTSDAVGADPNPDTVYNEQFPHPGLSKLPAAIAGKDHNCADTTGNWASNASKLQYFIPSDVRGNGTQKGYIASVCQDYPALFAPPAGNNWEDKLNKNLSRMEASRTAMLSLLIELEKDYEVSSTLDMGLLTWSSYQTRQVPSDPNAVNLESTSLLTNNDTTNSDYIGKYRFKKMRDRLLWVNRGDPQYPGISQSEQGWGHNPNSGTITYNGNTHMYQALEDSARMVKGLRPNQNPVTTNALNSYGRRIIVFFTDGEPWPQDAPNTPGQIVNLAKQIGNNAPGDQKITVFTVGLIQADANLMSNIANQTPNGLSFNAKSITELSPIFEQIAYQVKIATLQSSAKKYGVTF